MNAKPETRSSIIFKTQVGFHIIPKEEIVFCEADGSYCKIHLEDGSEVTVSKTLIFVEKILNNGTFIRCHNSFLVNSGKVEKINRKVKTITVSGQNIPVSRRNWQYTIKKLTDLLTQ